ncbi:hypothetical protein BJX61DRAFT_532043 [Aspergillus egyptiacus]|nr:hypothetical protein BJX61DRAFT_532043 [Aspergillus egyptiacus]
MNQPGEGEFSLDKLPKSVKVRSTCNACQQAKIRCSHERPSCKRCQKHNIECVYSISRRLGRPAKKRDPILDGSTTGQGGSDGQPNKRPRGPKKKRVKEEPTPNIGGHDLSASPEEKVLLDTLGFSHGHVDSVSSADDPILQTPTFMDFSVLVSDNVDMASDSWLHEFISNPFTDSTQECGFFDPLSNDTKVNGAKSRLSVIPDDLPESISKATPEPYDLPSSSNYFAAVNGCLAQNEPMSSITREIQQSNSVYPEHLGQDTLVWTQPLSALAGDFSTEQPSLFSQPKIPKRAVHDFSFSGDEFKESSTGLPSMCPCQDYEQTARDLGRVIGCTLRTGPPVTIDTILNCQKLLQQMTETILQCHVCSRTGIYLLNVVIMCIDSLTTALDAIASADSDAVDRLFPECFKPLAQDYRSDSSLSHGRWYKRASLQLRRQLDACPLIIGGFCVPSEEKFLFVKRVLHRRLSGLLGTVHQIQMCTKESLTSSAPRWESMMIKETYQRLRLAMPPPMDSETSCQCSIGALQIMNELRSVHTVVDLETILALVERIHDQGQSMLKCKECRANPTSFLMTFPALTDQCLALFEAACLAYSVMRKSTTFDAATLPFEQPLPQYLCIRSKIQLGEMELDEYETGVLVRVLLGKNSAKLKELLKALRSLSKENGRMQGIDVSTLRACESSVGSAIHRMGVFIEQIDGGSAWPGALKTSSPLTPADHFSDQGLSHLTFSNLIGMIKIKRLVEGDNGPVSNNGKWDWCVEILASQNIFFNRQSPSFIIGQTCVDGEHRRA